MARTSDTTYQLKEWKRKCVTSSRIAFHFTIQFGLEQNKHNVFNCLLLLLLFFPALCKFHCTWAKFHTLCYISHTFTFLLAKNEWRKVTRLAGFFLNFLFHSDSSSRLMNEHHYDSHLIFTIRCGQPTQNTSKMLFGKELPNMSNW